MQLISMNRFGYTFFTFLQKCFFTIKTVDLIVNQFHLFFGRFCCSPVISFLVTDID